MLLELRQINLAAIMFADEHDGRLPMVGGNPPTADDGVLIRWFGGWRPGDNRFVAEAALLAEYWGDAQIGGCPTLDIPASRPEYGPVDYAYNSELSRHWDWVDGIQGNAPMPTGGKPLARIGRPTETAMFFDSARIMNGEPDRTPWGFPSSFYQANFHGRHGGEGNVGWADGHVSPFKPASYPEHGPEAPKFNIGTIDSDGDIDTDEHF